MELSFRENIMESDRASAHRLLLTSALVIPVLSATVPMIGGPIRFFNALAITIVLSMLAVALLIGIRQRTRLRDLALTLFTPALLITLLYLVNTVLFASRPLATVFLAFPLLALLFRWTAASVPFGFYREWLLSHPRLRSKTRHELRSDYVNLPVARPGIVPVVLTAFLFVGMVPYSPTAALIVWSICMFVLALPVLSSLRSFRDVFALFIAYSGRSSGAAGVWMPNSTLAERRWSLLLTYSLLCLLIAVNSGFFCPEDRSTFYAAFVENRALNPSPYAISLSSWWTNFTTRHTDPLSGVSFGWFFLSLPFAVLLPNLCFMALFAAPFRDSREFHGQIEGTSNEPPIDGDSRVEWECHLDRMTTSAHVALSPTGETLHERDHLFIGTEPHIGFPILLDRKILNEHCYIVGDSGSGKTSLGIMPLLIQLIRGYQIGDSGERSPKVPVVVLDLKGDPALFNTVKSEAEARGQEFLFFNIEPGYESNHFNPFLEFSSSERSRIQLCELIMESLALSHGEGYGRSYFTRQAREALFEAILQAEKDNKPINDFKDLFKSLERLERSHKREAAELLSTIHVLGEYPKLSTKGKDQKDESVIQMRRVIERPQVVYFWLPAALESVSVREIAKLALFSLLSAAIDRQKKHAEQTPRPDHDPPTAYLVIDEFQRIAGENFKIILEQARSFGVSAILANQSQADLKTRAYDLGPTVRTNTRTKFYFSVTDPEEVRTLANTSGEEVRRLRSGAKSAEVAPTWKARETVTDSWVEAVNTRLSPNDIYAVNDSPNQMIFHVSRGSGYTQFGGFAIPARVTWPMEYSTYAERKRTPLPRSARSEKTSLEETLPQVERRVLGEDVEWLQQKMADILQDIKTMEPGPPGV